MHLLNSSVTVFVVVLPAWRSFSLPILLAFCRRGLSILHKLHFPFCINVSDQFSLFLYIYSPPDLQNHNDYRRKWAIRRDISLFSALPSHWSQGLTPEAGTLGLGLGHLTNGLGLPLEEASLWMEYSSTLIWERRELSGWKRAPRISSSAFHIHIVSVLSHREWRKEERKFWEKECGEDPNVGHTVGTLKVPVHWAPQQP